MAITYSVANNIITVTGYTEGTPCNFTDIYNADKAGALSLHARTGITGTDGAAVAVDRAERPADYIVLGGASNDLYITVANWNGTTATIRITGTDRDGAAQTEDIVVNANGAFYTTKWFKTITHTQVTVFTATSFDYDLTQGQWGVVWNTNLVFTFDAKLQIGDGSTTTWFTDIKKQVVFSNYSWSQGDFVIRVKNNATFIIGKLNNASLKDTEDGCSIIDNHDTGSYYLWFIDSETGSTVNIYSSFLSAKGANLLIRLKGTVRIWNSNLAYGLSIIYGININCFNIVCSHNTFGIQKSTGTFDKMNFFHQTNSYFRFTDAYGGTFENCYGRGTQIRGLKAESITADCYVVNADLDVWTLQWIGTSTAEIYRQYNFDLKAIDKDNAPINGATVKIWDKDSNLIVDTTTNASGVITTQTISRGYYDQAHGSTLQEKSPHLIKIEKSGYTAYEADFTLEDKTDWLIALQTSILRNPSMGGGMS